MAAGDAFSSLSPDLVTPMVPEYHNVITPSESMKKEYMNVSATSVKKWRLLFKAISNTDRETILAHYNDQYGGYQSFVWESVPSYIESGANITGRWVGGSLNETPLKNLRWDVEIDFEKDNT